MLKEKLSRREIISGTGLFAAGAVLGKFGAFVSNAEAKGGKTEKWPWPYEKLDPEKTAEIAYKEWYNLFCGASVINSIFSQLRDKVGEPYKSFPIDAFIHLHGGIAGWGTMCGCPAGACVVTNTIVGPGVGKTGELMGSEIVEWYAETSLPFYVPKNPKQTAKIPQSVSHSPLCHASVNKWMKTADKGFWTPERQDRCARLTASTAYHTVELLNEWKDGKYVTKGKIPAQAYDVTSQHNCTDCHGSNVPPVNMKGNPAK